MFGALDCSLEPSSEVSRQIRTVCPGTDCKRAGKMIHTGNSRNKQERLCLGSQLPLLAPHNLFRSPRSSQREHCKTYIRLWFSSKSSNGFHTEGEADYPPSTGPPPSSCIFPDVVPSLAPPQLTVFLPHFRSSFVWCTC